MQTVNISLTSDQLKNVDSLAAKHGFANRSEFFRSLLRFVIRKPEVISIADNIAFSPPDTKNSSEILNDFKASKKYSPAFLKDLKKGLKESTYFEK